jgi:tripartite-type tricarboxylate transporter receptor subunit TctC
VRKLIVAAVSLLAIAGTARAAWPERPVNLIVPWAAGGGTDAIARLIATGIEKELGKPVNVINRVGGSGVVGHTEIVNAKPDGYTIGLATAEFITYYWAATAPFTYEQITPIALVNFDPAALQVAQGSPLQSLGDALEAIRREPAGTFKMSAPVGGAYHLAFAGLLQEQKIDPKKVVTVPAQGAAPGLQELASGGVQMVPFSLPEGKAMIDAGKVRPLVVMARERVPAYPNVPTVKDAIGVAYEGGTWRGIVAPGNLPADVAAKVADAVQKVVESAEFKTFMSERGFGTGFMKGEQFRSFLADQHKRTGEVMEALGLRQRK